MEKKTQSRVRFLFQQSVIVTFTEMCHLVPPTWITFLPPRGTLRPLKGLSMPGQTLRGNHGRLLSRHNERSVSGGGRGRAPVTTDARTGSGGMKVLSVRRASHWTHRIVLRNSKSLAFLQKASRSKRALLGKVRALTPQMETTNRFN